MKMINRFMKKAGLYSIVAVCLAFALGCSSPAPDITGKWSNEKTQESFEFLKDNTYMYQSMGIELSGKWKPLDDGKVEIDIPGAENAKSYTGKIEGGNLILEMGDQKTTLQKVK